MGLLISKRNGFLPGGVAVPRMGDCTDGGPVRCVMDKEELVSTTLEDVIFFIVLSDTAVVVNIWCVDLVSENPEM